MTGGRSQWAFEPFRQFRQGSIQGPLPPNPGDVCESYRDPQLSSLPPLWVGFPALGSVRVFLQRLDGPLHVGVVPGEIDALGGDSGLVDEVANACVSSRSLHRRQHLPSDEVVMVVRTYERDYHVIDGIATSVIDPNEIATTLVSVQPSRHLGRLLLLACFTPLMGFCL